MRDKIKKVGEGIRKTYSRSVGLVKVASWAGDAPVVAVAIVACAAVVRVCDAVKTRALVLRFWFEGTGSKEGERAYAAPMKAARRLRENFIVVEEWYFEMQPKKNMPDLR